MNKKPLKPLLKSEIPSHIKVDLKSQHIVYGKKRYGYSVVNVICIKCGKITEYPIGSLRNKFKKGFSGCCQKCHPRWRTKTKGGIKYGGGYRYLHVDIIEPEIIQSAKKAGINVARPSNYIAEHRVIAFRKYGSIVFEKGILVRHLDGNKINNSPDNLVIGTNQDNVNDHVTARREAALWRTIALTLFSMLKNRDVE